MTSNFITQKEKKIFVIMTVFKVKDKLLPLALIMGWYLKKGNSKVVL